MKKITFLLFSMLLMVAISCERDEKIEPVNNSTVNLVGTWSLDSVVIIQNNVPTNQMISDCQKKSTLVFGADKKASETEYDTNSSNNLCEVDFSTNYSSYSYNETSKIIKLNFSDGTSYEEYKLLEYSSNSMLISYSANNGNIIVQKKYIKK